MTTKNIEWLIGRLRAFSGTSLAPALMHQAADTLQSQAERVKVLELDLDVQAGSIEAVQAVNARQAERIKELEGQLVALEADYAETRDELQEANDSLASTYHILGERDAQLAEIAESEPVIWAISYDGVTPYTLWHEGDGALLDLEVKRQGGTTQKMPLFTRPMPVQDVPEVGFGNIPTKFLANGTRFKLSFDTRGRVSSLWNFMDELDGRWVALVAAEDDCHLQSAQPAQENRYISIERVEGFPSKLENGPQPVLYSDSINGCMVRRDDVWLALTSQLRSAQPVAPLTDDEILTIAHRKATRYTHAVAPGQVTYGFSVVHLLDFANGIREVK